MNDKTYADGLKDAAKVADRMREKFVARVVTSNGEYNEDSDACVLLAKLARQIRSLTPDKTNTTEATAIGSDIGTRCEACGTAAPTSFAADCNRPECAYRAKPETAASPKPDTNTSVDPAALSPQQDQSR